MFQDNNDVFVFCRRSEGSEVVWGSLLGAAVVSQRRALDVCEDGGLQVAGSVGFVLPHPLDLRLLQTELLQHGGHLTLFVQEHLLVAAAEHCRTASIEGERCEKKEHISYLHTRCISNTLRSEVSF